jgi:hypothetical protein
MMMEDRKRENALSSTRKRQDQPTLTARIVAAVLDSKPAKYGPRG